MGAVHSEDTAFPGGKEELFCQVQCGGLLRGDYASRMSGYATARQNGWMSANDIRELENMDVSLPRMAAISTLSMAICSRLVTPELLQIHNRTMTERRKTPMKKFWKWKNLTVGNQENQPETVERTLFLNGTIAEESWFDDDITPQLFKEELMAGSGDITVWINSPGGDCVAAAQIYNMLMDYKATSRSRSMALRRLLQV